MLNNSQLHYLSNKIKNARNGINDYPTVKVYGEEEYAAGVEFDKDFSPNNDQETIVVFGETQRYWYGNNSCSPTNEYKDIPPAGGNNF